MNSETVRAIRVSKGLSQTAFAKSIGVAESTIAAVESGHRRVSYNLQLRIKQRYGGDEAVEEAFRRAKEFDKMALT